MKDVLTAVSVICASALICTLVSTFVTDGSTKKILNLVLGAFMICSLIVPVKNAVQSFNIDISDYESAEDISATDDEAYSRAVLSQTKENLEQTLNDLLLQNNIKINSCEINLALTDENSIIISSVCIYISNEYTADKDLIVSITKENFGISPSVITE
ncbi:MAG: stage III sporulation protein AF [Clostridiales bacterium]|nr:stage III sporulation protein AF [Clostridiales bacterium]